MERRKHRRYIARGRVKFTVDSLELWGDLVNFGHGGMLIRSRNEVPEKTELNFRVIAYCYPNSFEVPGQIVGGKESLLAIRFLERTDGARELLRWLESENFPWTGGSSSEEAKLAEPVKPSASNPVFSLGEAEADASMEVIFQDA
ncbi:MAG: PilZ domain-containing protein [Acidobacteria bacterium]|nr:PilZ domain-containing protein [Acidobacteriota bacterium]